MERFFEDKFTDDEPSNDDDGYCTDEDAGEYFDYYEDDMEDLDFNEEGEPVE